MVVIGWRLVRRWAAARYRAGAEAGGDRRAQVVRVGSGRGDGGGGGGAAGDGEVGVGRPERGRRLLLLLRRRGVNGLRVVVAGYGWCGLDGGREWGG